MAEESGKGNVFRSLLQPGTGGIVQADQRSPCHKGLGGRFSHFLLVHRTDGSSHYGKVLGIQEQGSAIDLPIAGYHPISGQFLFVHSQPGATMLCKEPQFSECPGIQESIDSLPRSQFPFSVLRLNLIVAPTFFQVEAPFMEFSDFFSP